MQTKAERRDDESSSKNPGRTTGQAALADRAAFHDLRPEAVAQRQNKDLASTGPRMAQQRVAESAIGNKTDGVVTAPNRTGLPDQLKSGIESLSGIGMDGVKVHYNSSRPAQLNAYAYAQGTDIHIAPGQEKHLPHEAWHVVQQAQGRVRRTLQMKAGAVNDDPSLEKEADIMGEKAAQFEGDHGARNLLEEEHVAGVATECTAGFRHHATLDSEPVQRKMGFEFETAYTFEVHDGEDWQAVGRQKGQPFFKGNGFVIEGDTKDNCEFILDPFESKEEAAAAAAAATDLTFALDGEFGPDNLVEKEVGGNWLRHTRIRNHNNEWEADAQVTQGVKLEDLPSYIDDHLDRPQRKAHETRVNKAQIPENTNAQVRGITNLIIKFVADLADWDGSNNEEGPKNAQVWMARTKYVDMVRALGGHGPGFAAQFFDANNNWIAKNPVTKATQVNAGDRVIPKSYRNVNNKRTDSLITLQQWIVELCAGGAIDSMSPPLGWAGGNYGMGLLGMDAGSGPNPLVLLEYRKTDNREPMNELSGKGLVSAWWEMFVEQQFDKALKWNPTLREYPETPNLNNLFAAGGGVEDEPG